MRISIKIILLSILIFFLADSTLFAKEQNLCYTGFQSELDEILSVNPKKYTIENFEQLTKVTNCFNELQLPDLTLYLLLDKHEHFKFKDIPKSLKGKLYLVVANAFGIKGSFNTSEIFFKKAISSLIESADYQNAAEIALQMSGENYKSGDAKRTFLFSNMIKSFIDKLDDPDFYKFRIELAKAKALALAGDTINSLRILNTLSMNNIIDKTHRINCYLNLTDLFLILDKPDSAKIYLSKVKPDSSLNLKNYYFLKSSYYKLVGDSSGYTNYFSKFNNQLNKEKAQIEEIRNILLKNKKVKRLVRTMIHKQSGLGFWDITLIAFNIFLLVILLIIILIITTQRKKLKFQKAEIEELKQKKHKLSSEISSFKFDTKKRKSKEAEQIKEIEKEIKESTLIIKELKEKINNTMVLIDSRNKVLLQINFFIRSLLSNILEYSNMLKTEFARKGEAELYNYADNIENSSLKFMNIIDIFSSYIAVISGSLKIKSDLVNVNEIVTETVENNQMQADNKKIKIVFNPETDVSFYSDQYILKKIINTAVGIALNNTNKGFIKIKTSYDEKDKVFIIEVTNTGKGFDKAYLKDILEPYSREGLSYIPGYVGTGMEFPLLNKLAELLNGTYSVQSDIGKGIKQTVMIPAEKTVVQEKKDTVVKKEKAVKTSKIPWKGKKVLVVEDDPLNQLLFDRLLEEASFKIIAPDGDKALRAIQELYLKGLTFDMVLMDINLPQPWDGIVLMKEIKKRYDMYHHVPFIAQTAYAMHGDREKFINYGFNEYIPKPIIKPELIHVVCRAMQ
jgi:CheY-like chemotaxis protein